MLDKQNHVYLMLENHNNNINCGEKKQLNNNIKGIA